MSLFEAIVLGALQGLTEFLPISSSGHLVLMQHFLGVSEGQVTFDVVLHLGTLGAVVVVYRQTLWRMVRAVGSAVVSVETYRRPVAAWHASEELRWVGYLILGSIPTGLIGWFFQEPLEAAFSSPRVAAVMLLVTGVILQLPRLRRSPSGAPPEDGGEIRAWHAPIIGVVQGMAIVPGISRSGSTISTGLLLGVSAEKAARFSFLLSIPAILGATLLKVSDAGGADLSPLALVIGAASSFLVGWASLVFLLEMLRRGKFSSFSFYCFAVGILALLALTLEGAG